MYGTFQSSLNWRNRCTLPREIPLAIAKGIKRFCFSLPQKGGKIKFLFSFICSFTFGSSYGRDAITYIHYLLTFFSCLVFSLLVLGIFLLFTETLNAEMDIVRQPKPILRVNLFLSGIVFFMIDYKKVRHAFSENAG